ncbi:alpha/beta hydrolase fold domain-containing protein [Alteribacillus sp. YIM 98480]|uniref:alpha/beta hydrolase fold domain-containing protein n=1 Tax=Alteribacillus sp. YIM 98480 TaxID=2606599 RepID=UPI00131E16E9
MSTPLIAYQLLLYPTMGVSNTPSGSMKENSQGYFLTEEMMTWFRNQYLHSLYLHYTPNYKLFIDYSFYSSCPILLYTNLKIYEV